MTVYRATVLFMTVGMLVLHVLEWKTAVGLEPAIGPCFGGSNWAQKLRLALRLEAMYYVLVLPLLYTASNTLVGQLMSVSAVYHWAGLVLMGAATSYGDERPVANRALPTERGSWRSHFWTSGRW
jgi:hypothetical protein